jgi:LmbE family N-acetylglucosaminyl deacetylase
MIPGVGKALILAPHTDDGELGCGGTMCKLIESGCRVYYAAFSICEDSVPEGFEPEALLTELYAATAELGLQEKDIFVLRNKVRRFGEVRQDILEYMIKLRYEINPDWVFMPCSRSLHQDHQVIHNEGMRAFKGYPCLGYDLPWDSFEFPSTSFNVLQERHVERKISALKMYKTQAHRGYVDGDFIKSLARVRGEQGHCKWAESFEVLRIIFR